MTDFVFVLATLLLLAILDGPVRRVTKNKGSVCMMILALAAAWFGIYILIIKPAL